MFFLTIFILSCVEIQRNIDIEKDDICRLVKIMNIIQGVSIMNKNKKRQSSSSSTELVLLAKELLQFLWKKPFIKFVIIAFFVLTIQGMILDAIVPAFFTHSIFWTIASFEATVYCFFKQDHYFENENTQTQGKIFMFLTLASILLTLGYAIRTIILVINWILSI